MVNELFWNIIKQFNYLMNSAIEGPSCIDPSICHGNCCSIKIDVPKILAKEYIKRGYAKKEDFIRTNVFSFHLRFEDATGKCFLFEKQLNGCRIHNTGIKPPQCWIYPTNFSNTLCRDIKCKNASGWKIIDSKKTKEAEKLLKTYVFLCQLEANKEVRKIKNKLSKRLLENNLGELIKKYPPSHISGVKYAWNDFKILPAEGFSLQMKKFCLRLKKKCDSILNNAFFECKSVCSPVSQHFIEFLQQNLFSFIKKNGPNHEGAYPLHILFDFVANEKV